MIWIAGGDQSNYINFWKGTAVQTAFNARIAQGVRVGGTSAGLNVLTQFVHTAAAKVRPAARRWPIHSIAT